MHTIQADPNCEIFKHVMKLFIQDDVGKDKFNEAINKFKMLRDMLQ